MNDKRKSRFPVWNTGSGRGKQSGKTSPFIVRQSGIPVNDVFCCGFVHDVFDLLAEPITVEEIARQTASPVNRVLLALHELRSAGVVIT